MADRDPPYLPPGHELAGLLNPLLSLVAPPRRKQFDLRTVSSLTVVERVIPLSTLYFFFDFSFEGSLPSGGKSTLPLITEDEVHLLGKPYAEWAKAPWSSTSSNLQARLLDTPDHFCVEIPRKISCIRARLWEGMTPISEGQFKARKWDDTANWQSLIEFLFDIIHVFTWLGNPDTTHTLRDSFNHISSELGTFEAAINARREEKGNQTKLNMRALWLEYIKSLFNTMVARTHTFFRISVKTTIAKARAEYTKHVEEHGESRAEAKRCGEIWSDLERVLHRADSYIMMPLNGFDTFSTSPNDTKVVGSLLALPFRWDQRQNMENERPWPLTTQHADDPRALYADHTTLFAVMDESDNNHDHVRLQQRGETMALQREPWVNIIHSRTQWSLSRGGPRDQKWGFVGYMLTHTPSHAEWEAFFSRVYTDFLKSGQGVEGFGSVKPNMDIQWINAKDSQIPHDNIEAAKRHFQAFRNAPACRRRVLKTDFLVVDSECFASYMNPKPQFGSIKCSGDNDGYFKLVDMSEYRSEVIRDQSPGYTSQMRVLGRLVFDDLYPQLTGLVQRPRDLWPLAMLHPNQVYIGIPVQGQLEEWESIRKARILFWIAMRDWLQSRAQRST